MRRFEHLEQWIPVAIMLLAFLADRGRKLLAEAARRRREASGPRQYDPIEPESPWSRLLEGMARWAKSLERSRHYVGAAFGLAVVLLVVRKGDLPTAVVAFAAVFVVAALTLRTIRAHGPGPDSDEVLSIRNVPSERKEEP